MKPTLVSQLNSFPLKSAKAHTLAEAVIDNYGLRADRSFMIVDQDGNGVTARDFSHIGLIELSLNELGLALSAPGQPPLGIAYEMYRHSPITVQVWGQVVNSYDLGDAAANWVSRFVHQSNNGYRIVEKLPQSGRSLGELAELSFSDMAPILVLSQASLDLLNSKLDFDIDMANFRANIIVDGCAAHAEDSWESLTIGNVQFRAVGPCPRCIMTTLSAGSALQDLRNEPINTLMQYRQGEDGNLYFGSYFYPVCNGTLKLGDELKVKTPRTQPTLKATPSVEPATLDTVKQPADDEQQQILRCVAIVDETAAIKSFIFESQQDIYFSEGQFGVFKLKIYGKTVQRCYSFSSANQDKQRIKISVKREPQGLVSNYLHDFLAPGDTVEMLASYGDYTLQNQAPLALIAAGSGITPNIAILEKLLQQKSARSIVFIYSAAHEQDLAFIELLQDCQTQLKNFQLILNLSRQALSEIEAKADLIIGGRLDQHTINKHIPDLQQREIYFCGPEAYRENIRAICMNLGLNDSQLHDEAFSSSFAAATAGEEVQHQLTFSKSGITVQASNQDSLLDSALKAGIKAEHSCKIGACGRCEATIVTADIAGAKPSNNDPDSNKILLCCSFPNADMTIDL